MPDKESRHTNIQRGWDFNIRIEDYGRSIIAYPLMYRSGVPSYISEMVLSTLGENQLVPENTPVFELSHASAQKMMDDLWNIGFRPIMSRFSDDATKNMAAHLEDMRTISFKFLKIQPPKK